MTTATPVLNKMIINKNNSIQPPPVFIGLTGRAGAGKDTVAEFIENILYQKYDFNTESIALADRLKQTAKTLFRLPTASMHDRKMKEEVIPEYNLSPRQILQKLGTALRNEFGSDIFTAILDEHLSINPFLAEVHIITDIRYQNEAEWLLNKPNSILIVIQRPGDTDGTTSAHASEKGLDLTALGCYDRIYALNNDSDIHNLKYLVEQLVTKLYSNTPVEVK